ncbi:uncharacterized protein LOC126662045 [Mercurialis annua]|uniref:uncharacterized protein LOC126662045 n=1 Tax=Mercurialis annua TaxID=3986 RepID=UPI00215EAC65|nr:uncharacterized protein LOC126662045 [Mercurialis annua]
MQRLRQESRANHGAEAAPREQRGNRPIVERLGARNQADTDTKSPDRRNAKVRKVWMPKGDKQVADVAVTAVVNEKDEDSSGRSSYKDVLVSHQGGQLKARLPKGREVVVSHKKGVLKAWVPVVRDEYGVKVVTLPNSYRSKPGQKATLEGDVIVPEGHSADSTAVVSLSKPPIRMIRHIRPLYIKADLNGVSINRVLIDNGAGVNILPVKMLKKLGITRDQLDPTDVYMTDFAGGETPAEGYITLRIKCATPTPSACISDPRGQRPIHHPQRFTMMTRHKELREKIRQLTSLYDISSAECIYEDQDQDPTGSLRIEDIRLATGKLEDDPAQVQDDIFEVNLGTDDSPKPIYINAGLDEGFREQLVALLVEFRDCFAWSYDEMPGLDPDIAEYKLPLKSGFRPFRQPPRRMSREVDTLIQDEIKRLEDAKFIREAQYTEWLSNIVPVMKKNGKLRVCVDFRNLNLATPKDEYPMPVADMLIDRAAGHTILRATYQRAMNKMFRGLDCLEVCIDDVVIKSNTGEIHLADLRKGFERIRRNGLKMNHLKCAFGVSAGNFLAGRLRSWSVLLRGKETDEWIWTDEQQRVFDDLKGYLAKPPVMTPPKPNKPLLLYLSAAHESLGCMLAQEDDEIERAVYYLSRGLTGTEIHYTDIEKMCLCMYFTCCKLRYYMLPVVVYVLSQTDIIKYILSKPYLRNRIGKWAIAMSEFTLVYVPQRAVKGQVLADFLADHLGITLKEETVTFFDITVWKMWFDGSRTSQGAGAGAEYEALIFGFEVLAELGARAISVKGDSLLVIKQVTGEFKCESELLGRYCNKAKHLIEGFQDTRIEYTERADNGVANDLAQHGSGYKVNREFDAIERETPNLHTGGITIDERQFSVYQLDVTQDWRVELLKWFEKPDLTDRRLRTLALNYVVLAGELYKKGFEGLLFRCIGPKEAMLVMAEVHEGIAGAHQAGPRMRWLIHKYGFYWPKMEQDCGRYTLARQTVILFVIIATCYFTKWVEAKPLKSPTQEAVIKFFKEYIVHRHGLPESITTDQGTMFTGGDISWWASQMKIKMLHLTPYYAQANGQAEATNKTIKLIVQKMIEENPRQWHVFLSEAVWANRTSQKSATGTSPFRLVYGYDAMLPMELTVTSTRRKYQSELSKDDYFDKMVIDSLDFDEERLTALDHLEAQKRRVERAYNKRVKRKTFSVGDIVWKAVLPIGHKDTRLGKWSPNWEGPVIVVSKLTGGAYLLANIDGEEHDRAINGQFLKKYVPSCWEGVARRLFGANEE